MLATRPDLPPPAQPTPEEQRYLSEIRHWLKEETGYLTQQGTRPQTLAYGLTDSPIGLATWIAEKFHVWTDHDGNFETVIPRDEMLADISLYWFTGAIGSSFWPYYDRLHGPWPVPGRPDRGRTDGVCRVPQEIRRPPRSIAEKSYTDIRQWTTMQRGGHFAAMEQPEALARGRAGLPAALARYDVTCRAGRLNAGPRHAISKVRPAKRILSGMSRT